MNRKGIFLAGGSGARLHPAALTISKRLLPVFDKPMIHYPLSTLMLASIREISIISTPQDMPRFQQLLGDGSQLGLDLLYGAQVSPDGLAQAFIIGETFIGSHACALMLGDNIFHGHDFAELLHRAGCREQDASVFAYHVHDPEPYGVVEFDEQACVSQPRRKTSAAQAQLRGDRPLFLRQPAGCGDRQEHQALSTWRTGDHRRKPRLSEAGSAEC